MSRKALLDILQEIITLSVRTISPSESGSMNHAHPESSDSSNHHQSAT